MKENSFNKSDDYFERKDEIISKINDVYVFKNLYKKCMKKY
jgi:hypothetical protein